MAIAFVNASGANATAANTVISADAFEATTGNTIVVLTSNYTSGGVAITGVADTALNTYTLCGTTDGGDANHTMECWVATNITGHAANIVTVTFEAAAAFRVITTLQYSGLAESSVFDAESAVVLDDSTVNHVTADITTTQVNEVVVGWFVGFAGPATTYSEASPSILRHVEGDGAAVDIIVSSVGTYNLSVDTVLADQQVSFAKSFAAGSENALKGSAMPMVFGDLMKVPQNGSW